MLSEIKKQNVKNMFDLLKNAAENFCDKTFLKWQEEEEILEKSFLETFKDSEKMARYIASLEKILGHRVHAALIGSASYEYVCSLFGVFGGNGVAIPIDNQISRENLIKNLLKADVDVLFFDFKYHSFATYVKKQIASRKIKFICLQDVDYESNFYSIINSDLGKAALPEIDPLKEALIIFTSGTTGGQKGVMLSHLNEISAIFSFDAPSHPIPQSDEIFLSILPIHHIYALNGNFLVPLRYGSTVCLCSDLKQLQKSIQTFNPTQIFMVPMIAKMLVNYFFMTIKQNPDLPKDQVKNMIFGKNLFWLFIGGSSLPDSLEKNLIETGINIAQGYGLTEWPPPALQPNFDRQDKIKSVGKPVKNCQIRIQNGEIQVKSPSVMMGYYKEPELTKQAFTQDGFFKTGDLGYIDDDGFLHITGRKKNLIILSNGENVSPEQLENDFTDEFLIQDIIVYENSDKIVAQVYPNFQYVQAANLSDISSEISKIIQKHNSNFPSYCQIADVKVRKEPFEKTSSNKILRHKYTAPQSISQESHKFSTKPQTELQKKILEAVSRVTGNENIGIDDDLIDCGLNSLASMLLIEDFEKTFDRSITFNQLSSNRTIRKIEDLIINSKQQLKKACPAREKYPLIDPQNYYIAQKGTTRGNLANLLELDENIDLERLKNAVLQAIDAHPALKGIIKPDEEGKLELFRDDSRKIELQIEKVSDQEFEEISKNLVTPFKFDGTDNLFHIRLFKTPKSKYSFFDLSHIISDGVTINTLLNDINSCYMGQTIEKEKFSFYDYVVEYYGEEKQQKRKNDLKYYENMLKGLTLERSILNKKGKTELCSKDPGYIQKQFELFSRKDVIYFCQKHNISENVFLYTAFNYLVGIFSNLKHTFTRSTHGGRDDSRFVKTAGPFFKCYFCRYDVVAHETVEELLKKTKIQIMDTMKCQFSNVDHIEMFFQYQGDIYNVCEFTGFPAKQLPIKKDCIPFHIEIMSGPISYFVELTYWKDRFDKQMISNFLICYEHIANAMLTEKSARMLKHHIPSEMFPHACYITAKELNDEAGYSLLKNVSDDQKVRVYVLDDDYYKKPIGAWGRLYLKDFEPTDLVGKIKYPYRKGVILYDTGITARILPDGQIDFLENSGRVVLTEDPVKGLQYHDLGKLEKFIKNHENVKNCQAFMTFNPENGSMQLELEVQTDKDRFLQKIFSDVESSLDQSISPAVVKVIGK